LVIKLPRGGDYATSFFLLNCLQLSCKSYVYFMSPLEDYFSGKVQFSWTLHARSKKGKLLPKYIPLREEWITPKYVARSALNGKVLDFTQGETHYFADYIPASGWTAKKQ